MTFCHILTVWRGWVNTYFHSIVKQSFLNHKTNHIPSFCFQLNVLKVQSWSLTCKNFANNQKLTKMWVKERKKNQDLLSETRVKTKYEFSTCRASFKLLNVLIISSKSWMPITSQKIWYELLINQWLFIAQWVEQLVHLTSLAQHKRGGVSSNLI